MLIDLPFKKDTIGNFFLHIPHDGYNFSNKSLRIKAIVTPDNEVLQEFNIAQHMGIKGVYSVMSLPEFPSVIQHFTDYEVFFRGASDIKVREDQHPYNELCGVADNLDQILKHPGFRMFRDKTARQYALVVKLIRKADQPFQNGWKWTDKGTYIGTQTLVSQTSTFLRHSMCLLDEPTINEVLQFHFFEVRRKEK